MFKVSKLKFWKKTKIEVLSMSELVEQMDFAAKEVEETVSALVKLEDKLTTQLERMENIAENAQSIIDHHQAILIKSVRRKSEIGAQAEQIKQIVSSVKEANL